MGARKDADNIPPDAGVVMEAAAPLASTPPVVVTPPPLQQEDTLSNDTEPMRTDLLEDNDKGISGSDDAEDCEAMDVKPCDSDENSEEAVGKEDAAMLDQDLMLTDGEQKATDEEDDHAAGTAGKVSGMFQRLLNMNVTGPSGQAVLSLGGSLSGGEAASKTSSDAPFLPTLVQNGRMICNLPDHPIHAGATAIVAVIVDRTLTVSNAGDSRAVLCRNGTAFALSFDHKPMQEQELNRITKAGGFVNTFGRVNGNLNLSRSIGDLKYKQVPGIPRAAQMITAEPDIMQYVSTTCVLRPERSTCDSFCDFLLF